jgi:hypothetical protein
MSGPPAAPTEPAPPLSPEEWQQLSDQLDLVAEEKRRALADPGPSWREWWFYSASKWYLAVALFVLDAWLFGAALEASLFAVGLLAMVPTFYAEFVLWQYLYSRTPVGAPTRFRPTWSRPVRFGRWTAEGHAIRHGGMVIDENGGPDPRDFL